MEIWKVGRHGRICIRSWCTDTTYLEERPGRWVYLSSVDNENTHKIIAYKVSNQMTSDLVTDTVK